MRYATIKRIVEVGKGARSELGGFLLQNSWRKLPIRYRSTANELGHPRKIQEELGTENIYIINRNRDFTYPKASLFPNTLSRRALLYNHAFRGGGISLLKDSAAYLAVRMVMQEGDDTFASKINYALIEIPRVVNRFVVLPEEDGRKYIIILDDLIRHCLRNIFSIFIMKYFGTHDQNNKGCQLDIDSDLSRSFLEKSPKVLPREVVGTPCVLFTTARLRKRYLGFPYEKMGSITWTASFLVVGTTTGGL